MSRWWFCARDWRRLAPLGFDIIALVLVTDASLNSDIHLLFDVLSDEEERSFPRSLGFHSELQPVEILVLCELFPSSIVEVVGLC